MSMVSDIYPVMPTRPCSFCLRLQGGSVFADFDTSDKGIVSLRRISFDGFGCCEPREPISSISGEDSRLLLEAITRNEPSGPAVENLLRRYFRENKDVIWSGALVEHELI